MSMPLRILCLCGLLPLCVVDSKQSPEQTGGNAADIWSELADEMEEVRAYHSLSSGEVDQELSARSNYCMMVSCAVCYSGILRLEESTDRGVPPEAITADALESEMARNCATQAEKREKEALALQVTRSALEGFCTDAVKIFHKALRSEWAAGNSISQFCDKATICSEEKSADLNKLSEASPKAVAAEIRIHMVTFVTELYTNKFSDSLEAKKLYAKHHGYTFKVFNEDNLDCDKFREVRWRGDLRYCKIRAMQKTAGVIKKELEKKPNVRHYILWHDADTHIMAPTTKLESFITATGDSPVIFTDNALSLNNGVILLEFNDAGKAFFKAWAGVCKRGEWAWADNGCMYEAMLQYYHKDEYKGACLKYRAQWNPDRPEPPTGKDLMRCFNEEMKRLGTPCCGTRQRKLRDIAFLTGPEAFQHHPCDELKKAFSEEPAEVIEEHCWKEGMFLIHTKDDEYVRRSLQRARAAFKASGDEL
eukprot:TRINITY_DN10599_c0_g2_i1.p1 TRINITY_DN10599_c0_g2~~TRINITY_DN10599_c0_g2_i1.p1  ORF type:complete len:478 (-),score=119.47 TRINITY_DN10599_c0_g2_i1:285-1718(-)